MMQHIMVQRSERVLHRLHKSTHSIICNHTGLNNQNEIMYLHSIHDSLWLSPFKEEYCAALVCYLIIRVISSGMLCF